MQLKDYLAALAGKRVAVIGAGVSNTPLIRRLLAAGLAVTVRDKSEREKLGSLAGELEAGGAMLRLGPAYLEELTEDLIFKTPGLRPDVPELVAAAARGSLVTSEMELFFELCPCPIVAVTGSDGKTTTTTIIAKLLEAAGKRVHLGGNIGKPLLPEVDEMDPGDWAVVELSSFQLMSMKRSAHIAVITNIEPNHLDWHRDMAEYAEAKKNVYRFQTAEDRLVLNADNKGTASLIGDVKSRLFCFSRQKEIRQGCYFDGESIWYNNGWYSLRLLDRKDIRLPGLHNVENYMAAFAAVLDIVGEEVCRRVAAEFGGVEHRIEFVREKDGVRYYNDSIASSPTRSIAGLNSFEQKLILIAGGYDKHIPYDVLGPVVCEKVKTLVLVGATAPKIREAVEKAPNPEKPEIVEFTDFEAAVRGAAALAGPGDVVMLSPASASFDLFKNFMERGDRFKEIVNDL